MTRFAPLRALLSDHGWTVTSIELASECWWAKDIWKLDSEWTPKGATLYLSFLVDPMERSDLKSGDVVWAVGLTNEPPSDRISAERHLIALNRRFDAAMDEVVTSANDMRTAKSGEV